MRMILFLSNQTLGISLISITWREFRPNHSYTGAKDAECIIYAGRIQTKGRRAAKQGESR